MFRLLHFSTPMGSKETVIITTDFDAPASDFCPSGMTLDNDLKCDVISGGSIATLPLEDELKRS